MEVINNTGTLGEGKTHGGNEAYLNKEVSHSTRKIGYFNLPAFVENFNINGNDIPEMMRGVELTTNYVRHVGMLELLKCYDGVNLDNFFYLVHRVALDLGAERFNDHTDIYDDEDFSLEISQISIGCKRLEILFNDDKTKSILISRNGIRLKDFINRNIPFSPMTVDQYREYLQ